MVVFIWLRNLMEILKVNLQFKTLLTLKSLCYRILFITHFKFCLTTQNFKLVKMTYISELSLTFLLKDKLKTGIDFQAHTKRF